MPDLVDVIVVGSGAAGASAAFHLAARGRRVTLLERQSLPRPTPCGGGMVDGARVEGGEGGGERARSAWQGESMHCENHCPTRAHPSRRRHRHNSRESISSDNSRGSISSDNTSYPLSVEYPM